MLPFPLGVSVQASQGRESTNPGCHQRSPRWELPEGLVFPSVSFFLLPLGNHRVPKRCSEAIGRNAGAVGISRELSSSQ